MLMRDRNKYWWSDKSVDFAWQIASVLPKINRSSLIDLAPSTGNAAEISAAMNT
jgi:hypothetical protein